MFDCDIDEVVKGMPDDLAFDIRLRNAIQVGLLSASIEGDGKETVGDVVDSIFNKVKEVKNDR